MEKIVSEATVAVMVVVTRVEDNVLVVLSKLSALRPRMTRLAATLTSL